MAAKYEVKATKAGFNFNLKAPNGKYVLTSETYSEKRAALKGVESVRKNSQDPGAYEIRRSKRNEPYFVLMAKNKEIIGKSEMYKTLKGCRNGIASCQRFGLEARVEELG
jgi:uncharacterized protein YegP (UPF0339 family)